MTDTIVRDICIDELHNWLSIEGAKQLVERSSDMLSTFHNWGRTDPVTQDLTPEAIAANHAVCSLRSHLAVYELVSHHIEMSEK